MATQEIHWRYLAEHPIFDPEAFLALGTRAEEFGQARPFKHVVIENLFRPEFLKTVHDEFYPPNDPRWHRFKDPGRQVKLMLQSEYQLPPAVKDLIRELNAEPFLRQLSALTGIEGLIPDPYLVGGGMHQLQRGGKLAIHADFNKHTLMKLDRRLNLLVYLNEDWPDAYGGHLELWDRDMKACEKRIAPIFNRTVVFLTDDFSYHGNPEPVECPPERGRKSIALYYYTNGRPAEELSPEGDHTTLFRERPNEVFAEPNALAVTLEQGLQACLNGLRRSVPRPAIALAKKILRR
ncbi:MAG TPA: 2OG-Fe(II) oxygenase [Oscillatoriaceae cyanobacterium]